MLATEPYIANIPWQKTHIFRGMKGVCLITMTLPLLNQARHIVFIITGEEKSRTVQRVL